MTTEDLGDPRLYEDEAIREQAAALQIHLENLAKRLSENDFISFKTAHRINMLDAEMNSLWKDCKRLERDHPL